MILKPTDFFEVAGDTTVAYLETLEEGDVIHSATLEMAMQFPIVMVKRSFEALNDGEELDSEDAEVEFYVASAAAMMGCVKDGVSDVLDNMRQALIEEEVSEEKSQEALELGAELGAIFRRLCVKFLNEKETEYNKSLN